MRNAEGGPPRDEPGPRLEILGRLAGHVAHDLNNLLAVLLGQVELLRRCDDPAEQREALDATEQALRRGADLTGQLLAFARRQPAGRRPVDLNGIAADVLRLLRRTAGAHARLELRLRPGLPALWGEPGPLAQLVFNLCLNACDALPPGGRLLVETDEVERPPFAPDHAPRGLPAAWACLRVSDNGEGMTPEVRSRIFEPFFTTKRAERGTGLGLEIVAEVVRRHGGLIECDSAPGRGTRFDVYLPAVPQGASVTAMESVESV
jgi:signal transduction histidine kinase